MPAHLPFTAVLILNLLAGIVRAEDAWPQFRGPTGLGYTTERELPVTWSKDGENVRWRSPLVGQGHASPIVVGGRVFVCTAHWPEDVKERAKVMPEHHVLCYDVADGRLVWDVQVPPGQWLRSDFRSGPGGGYACPTPTSDGKLVYCVFGSSVMAALDFAGKIAWRKELEPHTFDVTIGSSPVLWNDTLLMLCAMAEKKDSRMAAFDKATGELRWEQKFPEMGFGHSTPVVIRHGGRPQLLVAASGGSKTATGLMALDPADGKKLWWCFGSGESASPAFCDGLVYFDSGRGGLGIAVEAGGEGDVTESRTRWKIDEVPEGIGSPIIVDGRVYRLHSPNILKCWDTKTGKPVFASRLDGITTTWASPIADPAGRIYYASAGKSFVIQAGPKFDLLSTNDLGDANHASPAVAGGRLFFVGAKQVWCVGGK